MSIEVKYKGLDKLNREIDRMKLVLKKNPQLMVDIGQYVTRDIKKIFMEQGDPKWIPSGRARKGGIAKRGSRKGQWVAGQTLMKSGRLRNSITSRVEGEHIYIGTNVRYARIHHFGGKTGRNHAVNMPARPYMMVRPAAFKHIKVMIKQALKV